MRILIADDHDLLRDTIVLFLESEAGMDTNTAATLDEACIRIEKDDPYDLILLDYNMPGMNGLNGLSRALGLKGGQRVGIISGEATRDIAEKALAAGAAGFVPKTLGAKSMVNAVRFMAMGEQYAPIDFMTAPAETATHPMAEKLSPRELQVLKGLTEGKSNKEIAAELVVSPATIRTHTYNIYQKLDVHGRRQAVSKASDLGILPQKSQ